MVTPRTFDFEVFFDEIKALFEDNYNDCLTEINASKLAQDATDIPAKLIPNNHFLFGGASITQIGNTPIFIAYDFANANEITDNAVSSQSEKITLSFSINIVDNGLTKNVPVVKHLLRYQRAMKQLVNKNFDLFRGYGSLEVDKIMPAVYDINGHRIRSAGISISLTVGD